MNVRMMRHAVAVGLALSLGAGALLAQAGLPRLSS